MDLAVSKQTLTSTACALQTGFAAPHVEQVEGCSLQEGPNGSYVLRNQFLAASINSTGQLFSVRFPVGVLSMCVCLLE